MGEVARRLSDLVVLTDDNPRSEDPERIVEDICTGFEHPAAVRVQHDRAAAISETLRQAGSNDIVLIAGKGHEAYQIVGENRIPFSDQNVLRSEARRAQCA